MAITAAGVNNAQPRWVGSLDGSTARVERNLAVPSSGIVPGDFVFISSGAWAVWLDSGTNKMGGIYLGRDAGTVINTGGSSAVIPTPGIDLVGPGVFASDGTTGASAVNGAVLVISPNDLIEVDINANVTMTTVVVGAVVGGIGGLSYVAGTATTGWVFDLDASSVVDDLLIVHEILVAPTSTLRGRMVVRFHDVSKLSPGG